MSNVSMEETKFTRRSFLKGAGALGAAAALGGSLAYKPVEAFAEAADVASNTGEKEAIFGYCHMCMSHGNCSYAGTVKDGVGHDVPARQERDPAAVQPAPDHRSHEAHEPREGHGGRPGLG